jgi:hypothetical protein
MQIVCIILAIVLNFAVIGVTFKNYYNSTLTTFLANLGLNIVIDNFLIKPTMALAIGIPLSFSSSAY